MAAWDWYQCTIHGLGETSQDVVVSGLHRTLDLVSVFTSSPKNGYLHGAELRRGADVVATVWWGGNPGVHVKATGSHAPEVSAALRADWPAHAVTRCDAAVDVVESGLFDRVSAALLDYAAGAGISIHQQGDWHRGQARSLYLGAPTSTVRLVVYEKGYEAGGSLDWVRFECRVRPKGDAREAVASWPPSAAFGAAAWLSGALACIGWDQIATRSVGTVWRPSDAERSRLAVARQYGAVLDAWIADAGGLEPWYREFVAAAQSAAGRSPEPVKGAQRRSEPLTAT